MSRKLGAWESGPGSSFVTGATIPGALYPPAPASPLPHGRIGGGRPDSSGRRRTPQRGDPLAGLLHVLDRVHAAPEPADAVSEESALGGEVGEGGRLVVALDRQQLSRGALEQVDAGVDPERQRRALREPFDRTV